MMWISTHFVNCSFYFRKNTNLLFGIIWTIQTIVTGAINDLKGYIEDAKTFVTMPDGTEKEIYTFTLFEVGKPIQNNRFLLPGIV